MTTWTIDAAHTDVAFSAKHMMMTTVRGTFEDVQGTIELDETNPTASRGEIRVAAISLNTRFEARDEHLRSADFFDAGTHPWIVFRATDVQPRGGNRYAVTGDLEIRGTTRPVTFDVEYHGIVPGMRGRHVGFTARTKVNRKDWGLNWNMALEAGGLLVSDEVTLEVEVAADELAADVRVESAA